MPQIAGLIVGVVGAAVSVAGTISSQNAAGRARSEAAKQAEISRRIAFEQIALEEAATKEDITRQSRRVRGAQIAQFGSAGVSLLGSPLDVVLQTETNLARNLNRVSLASGTERKRAQQGFDIALGNIRAEKDLASAQLVGNIGGTLLTASRLLDRTSFGQGKGKSGN